MSEKVSVTTKSVLYGIRPRLPIRIVDIYLQCTCSIIRLLTDGGTPLLAMHR